MIARDSLGRDSPERIVHSVTFFSLECRVESSLVVMKTYTIVSKVNDTNIGAATYLFLLTLMQCFVSATGAMLRPVKSTDRVAASTIQKTMNAIRMSFAS